jgi:phosphoribosylaminoimidazolecarboxamide formyltransferase/IMP cyclohydrolase
MTRALISVHDKEGLIPFAQGLIELGIELIATPGTLKHLIESGIPAADISKVIGMPAILSARLKTIHPKIHGGILADRSRVEHTTQMRNLGLVPIDIVVVNIKPLPKDISLESLIEYIDIGGPALIHSAASNYKHVIIVTNPEQYPVVLKYLKSKPEKGDDEKFRANLAAVAFSACAHYDGVVASYMAAKLGTQEQFPSILPGHYIRDQYLAHGENEHQKAAFYRNLMSPTNNIGMIQRIAGSELSGGHVLEIDMAWEAISIFKRPTAAIVRYRNLVGIAVQNKIADAFRQAYQCDQRGASGAFIAINRIMDEETARLIVETDNLVEGIVASGYQDNAVTILKSHPVWGGNVKILDMSEASSSRIPQPSLISFGEGILLEEEDETEGEPKFWRIVTRAKPDENQLVNLAFALAIASISRSSTAIVARENATVGIGVGQPSSLDAISIAISKAGNRSKGAVLALSEPCSYPEAVQSILEAGISALIQPTDTSDTAIDLINAANEIGIPIVFCKHSHYRY